MKQSAALCRLLHVCHSSAHESQQWQLAIAAPPPKPWERQGGSAASSIVSPLGGATSSGVSHWDQPQSQG